MRWLLFWRPPCLLQRVIVNFTHDGTEALEGVLWGYRGGWLTLREVTAHKIGHPPSKLPGDAVVDRRQIAYLLVQP